MNGAPSAGVDNGYGNDIFISCSSPSRLPSLSFFSPAGNGSDRNCNDKQKRESISLAVAADVAQVKIADDAPHARGGAVANRLHSLLSHVASDGRRSRMTPLKDEIDRSKVKSTRVVADSSAASGSKLSSIKKGQSLASDNPTNGSPSAPSPPQPQKEFVFKRVLHAFDNFLHPPSKLLQNDHFVVPRQHHRAGNGNGSDCSSQQQGQQQGHDSSVHGQQQEQNCNAQKSSSIHSSFKHGSLASFSTNIASAITHNFRSNLLGRENSQKAHLKQWSQTPNKKGSPRPNGPLLHNCSDHRQHEAVVSTALHVYHLYQTGHDVTRLMHSQNGSELKVSSIGNEREKGLNGAGTRNKATKDRGNESKETENKFDHRARHALSSLGFEFRLDLCLECRGDIGPAERYHCRDQAEKDGEKCSKCLTRLYHVPSNSKITTQNRKSFIADGKMYDAVANLCQFAAQEVIAEACNMVWVTLCDGDDKGFDSQYHGKRPLAEMRSQSREEWSYGDHIIAEPIRALVGKQTHSLEEEQLHDTFLVSNGKGKVRAGIFSRSHLLTTGLEPSTALPLLRQARNRGMNCVVIDPNARGDKKGMGTFEISMRALFERQCAVEEGNYEVEADDPCRPIMPPNIDGSIYVLAHSASGGQLVRYLLDQQNDTSLLSRIRCITFTDSTHSIQWLRSHPHISSFIQSSCALYVKSANPMRDDDWENAIPGDECPKDHFWMHRFGEVKTVWAGTTEHSLSPWTARKPIWDHFDKLRHQSKCRKFHSENYEMAEWAKYERNRPKKVPANEKHAARIGTNPVVV